jgi:hypothetical protein
VTVRRKGAPAWLSALLAAAQVLGLGFPAMSAFGQSSEPSDRDNPAMVQAIFLYSFGRYVEWPTKAFEKPSSPFVIGILGDETFGGALEMIAAKKTIQGRRIEIRRFDSLKAYDGLCHILYVSSSVTVTDRSKVIEKTKGKPVFVVGAIPGFAKQGATADFITEEDRMVIEINVTTARMSQLRMDAKLLSLVRLAGPSPTGSDDAHP